MKLIHACLAAAAIVTTSLATPAVQAETIASKIEQLGDMTNVSVTGLRSAQRAGLLFVQATLSNRSLGDDQFEYRISWLDRDGFAAGPEEAWKPVLIHGNQTMQIQSIAPVPEAVDFRIQLHSPNNVGVGTASRPAAQ